MYIWQVIVTRLVVEPEEDRVLQAAARQRGEGRRPFENVKAHLTAQSCLGLLVFDDLAQESWHL